MALERVRALLARPPFRRLLATRLVGQTADGLLQSALATFVLFSPERQADSAAVATAFAILLLPYSLIGPFAGVLLDRWSRRNVLVRGDLVRALGMLSIAAFVAAGHAGPDLALAVLVVLGINRFVLAALSASLPHVVDGPRLVTANALVPTLGTMAAAVGGLTGVLLRSWWGGDDAASTAVVLVAALVCAVAGVVAVGFARRELGPIAPARDAAPAHVVRGLVAGARVLLADRPTTRAIGVVVVHRAVFGALIVSALVRLRLADPDPDVALGQFALVTGAAAGGAGLAALLTPAATRRFGIPVWTSAVLWVASVASTAGLVAGTLPGLLVAGAGMGVAGQGVKVCADAVTQSRIDDQHLGRVFSLYDVAVNVALVTGMIAMAALGQAGALANWPAVVTGLVLAATALGVLRARR